MKTGTSFIKRILNTEDDNKIIILRLIVGLIFISEGIQKFLFLEVLGPGLFRNIGFSHAYFWAYFTGTFEIVCGIFVLFGFLTRIMSVPLLIVMITAFISTKLPVLEYKGFWTFAHDYTTDFSMTLLLILLIIHGGGKRSVDRMVLRSVNS